MVLWQVEFDFSDYSSTVNTQLALRRVHYGGNNANLHLAMSLARHSVFVEAKGARLNDSSVTKLIVVVTDNTSTNKSATRRESELVRDAGVGMVTIGFGTHLDRYEMSALASYPYTNNMLTVDAIQNLAVLIDPVKRIICGGQSVSTCPVQAVFHYYRSSHVFRYKTKFATRD